jgi:RNA polymerase-interacting CarD/CdnL/TRCF family regulator
MPKKQRHLFFMCAFYYFIINFIIVNHKRRVPFFKIENYNLGTLRQGQNLQSLYRTLYENNFIFTI